MAGQLQFKQGRLVGKSLSVGRLCLGCKKTSFMLQGCAAAGPRLQRCIAKVHALHYGLLTFVFLANLQDTIVFGADDFDTAENRAEDSAAGKVPLGIGKGTRITRAIIDRNARIGRNVVLENKEGVVDGSNSSLPKGVVIKDGILVVLRDAVIPDGTEV